MSRINVVRGDLFDATEPFIVHQCNTISVRPHGLAAAIVSRLGPWTDVYSQRRAIGARNLAVPEDRPKPGTIKVRHSPWPAGPRGVIALFGQVFPSYSGSKWEGYYADKDTPIGIDTPELRLKYFKAGLAAIKARGIEKIAVPHRIGCGLAGGSWPDYEEALAESGLDVTIYRLAERS